MKVKSIELVNLRSYARAKIDLSPRMNLLIGANNSGKSTIIKALLNLQYKQFDEKDIRATAAFAKVFTELSEIDEIDNYRFYDPDRHKEYEIGSEFEINWHLNGQNENYLYYNSKHEVERLEHDRVSVKDVNGEDVLLKHYSRFSDSEDENNFIYPFLSKRKTEFYSNTISQEESFKVDQGLRNLAAKIKNIENPSHPKNSMFTALCDDILGFRIGTLAMEGPHQGMEPGIYVGHTTTIPLKGMGDGVATIVGFIVTLLTEDRKLYLIEELENDIHPHALKKLLSLIKEKSTNNQFVISTHSNIVLRYLGIMPEVRIFNVQFGRIDSIPTSTIEAIPNTPQARIDLLQRLGYEFDDFELYEAYLLLEESSAERIIRDFLIPNCVPSLYNRLKPIAAKGVDDLKARAIDFHRLFVFIHTSPIYNGRAWVVADGDGPGVDCIRQLKSTFNDWPVEHFINLKEANFESYYPRRFRDQSNIALNLRGDERRGAKKELLRKVMEWALTEREEAVKEFEESAGEIISLLRSIEKKLNPRS